jgi:carbonic anhydrase
VRSIKPAVAIAQLHGDADLKASATIENVRLNANRLSVSKPIIGQYVKEGKVKVVGGIYDLATGKVNLL